MYNKWGHNFRSSYLQIKSIIDTIDPKSVLALTATAGPPVINDICNTLKIPHPQSCNKVMPVESSVKVFDCNRENIDVSALFVQDEDQRLQMVRDSIFLSALEFSNLHPSSHFLFW